MNTKTLLFSMALCALAITSVSCGTASGLRSQQQSVSELRIGTFNLWRSDIGKQEYAWSERKDVLAQAVIDCNMDIFAAEEVDTTMFRELPGIVEAKGGRYAWKTFSPYREDGSTAMKAQAIVYKEDLFELIDFHYFWCSETPDCMSTGWDEMKFKRGACCATFRIRQNGERIFVMVSHFPLGAEARLHFADIILERARMYNPDGLPAFFMGDFNTREERAESQILRTYWNDAYLSTHVENRFGPYGSFNNHGLYKSLETAPRIDFVYYRGQGITPVKYVTDDAKYGQIYPSDHCPVYVDFTIKH